MYRKPKNLYFTHSSITNNSPRDLQILGSLQRLYRCSEYGELLVTPEAVWYYLKNKFPSYDSKQSLIESFNFLDCLTKLREGYYKLDTSYFEYKEEYVSCNYEVFELLKNKPGLLKHYLTILKCRAHNIEVRGRRNVLCSLPIEYFVKAEGIHINTISSYNKELENLKLIYIGRNTRPDGHDCNCYSLYEDRDYVKAFIGTSNTGVGSNWKRKISARYNYFLKDPERYSLEELETLLNDLNFYNDSTSQPKDLRPLLDKIKDMQYNMVEGGE